MPSGESPSLSRKPRGHAYPAAHRAGWASRSDRVRRNAPNSRGRSSAGPEARRALGERRHRFIPVDPADRTRRITTRKHPARQDARDRGVPRAILDGMGPEPRRRGLAPKARGVGRAKGGVDALPGARRRVRLGAAARACTFDAPAAAEFAAPRNPPPPAASPPVADIHPPLRPPNPPLSPPPPPPRSTSASTSSCGRVRSPRTSPSPSSTATRSWTGR